MRILVEVSWGIGNMVQGTPLCRALRLLGHEVDLFLNNDRLADAVAPLFAEWDAVAKVFTRATEIDFASYDVGICCFGEHLTATRMPPGFWYDFGWYNLRGRNEAELNLRPARLLGYTGPLPPSHVHCSDRDFELEPGTVVLHAGCDPANTAKRWPHWGEVCKRLQACGNPVVIVGTDADRSTSNWEAAWRCEFNLPLTDVAALLKQATAYMGNDSGVGHIAAAVGVPGVLLYGPSEPVKNAPNSKVLRQLIAPAQDGEGRQLTTGPVVPVERLSLSEVWAAVEAVLEDPQRDPARELPAPADEPVVPDISGPPPKPSIETADSMEEWLQELTTWHARQLMTTDNRDDVLRAGIREAARAHLRLSSLWRREPGGVASAQASFHAKAAMRAGAPMRGFAARVINRLSRGR